MPMLRARSLIRALVIAAALSWASPAAADQTIGGSCSGTVGSGPQSDGNNAACVSSLWQYPAYTVGNTSASCSGTNAGEVKYTSAALYFCDGTAWRNIEWSAASSTTPVFAAGAGYLVMSSGTWNGNMGGLSGADADCYSDLTSNNWMGKSAATSAGILTSGQVHAWLCNSSNCGAGALYASTTYYFAISGDASHGGATITTDTAGDAGYSGNQNTSDGNSWAASNYFNGSYYWWSNVAVYYSQAFEELPNEALQYYSCDDWTSTSADPYGIIGFTGASDKTRWSDTTMPCTSTEHLICVVQP
jgi:hypothetical protein